MIGEVYLHTYLNNEQKTRISEIRDTFALLLELLTTEPIDRKSLIETSDSSQIEILDKALTEVYEKVDESHDIFINKVYSEVEFG